jgi:tetratricopeptide (TPR) repeat protein
MAPRDIRPGEAWDAAIVEALVRSRVVVVLLSTASNSSSGVRNEVGIAGRRELPLLVLRLEDVEPSSKLEYHVGGLQWFDAFPPPIEQHLPSIADAVGIASAAAREPAAGEETALRRRADAGDAEACTNLGFLLLERGDIDHAEAWFRRGAEGGDALAATNLGLLMTGSDPTEADHWLRRGAEAGDTMAATTLGMRLRVRGDLGDAEQLLRQGAGAGDAMAATNLGLLLEEQGDRAGAEHWLRRGADAGDAFASEHLRRLLGGS